MKKALLAYLISMCIAFIVGLLGLTFTLNNLFSFFLVLATVMTIAHFNYVEKIYFGLIKHQVVFCSVLGLSAIIYAMTFIVERAPISFAVVWAFLACLLAVATIFHFRKEMQMIVEQLQQTADDAFLMLLKEIATEVVINDAIMHRYVIRNYAFIDIFPPLSKALNFQKRRGTFKDYECVITKRQIKINVLI